MHGLHSQFICPNHNAGTAPRKDFLGRDGGTLGNTWETETGGLFQVKVDCAISLSTRPVDKVRQQDPVSTTEENKRKNPSGYEKLTGQQAGGTRQNVAEDKQGTAGVSLPSPPS